MSMQAEELQARSGHLCAVCLETAQQCAEQLSGVLPASLGRSESELRRLMLRELGLLFRHWATREIWQRLDADQASATALNQAVLRRFVEAFKLPRDGSGLRYSSLGSIGEEARELSTRLTFVLGVEHQPLMRQLQAGIMAWREAVLRAVEQTLTLSREQLASPHRPQS